MGIDFSHGNASWSYGSFHRFRTQLFEETSGGLKLREMVGFNHGPLGEPPVKPGTSFDEYDHPIRDLIDHSDCDGELTPEQLKVIEPALRAHLETWPDYEGLRPNYDKTRGLELCEGMREAIENNENLVFM